MSPPAPGEITRPPSRASSISSSISGARSVASNASREHTAERIRTLSAMHDDTQLRTFGKWCNLHLPRDSWVEALERDLQDGRRLLHLLEILGGKPLPKPERGNLRFHKLSNVGKALSWIEQQRLPGSVSSIGPEDIVDGNVKLTLGLIWVLILRFQITAAIEDAVTMGTPGNREDTLPSDILSEPTSPSMNPAFTSSSPPATPNSLVGPSTEVLSNVPETPSIPDSTPSPPTGLPTMRKRSATNRAPDARASLLQWVRDRLAPLASKGLPEIRDLHGSWRSGALFAGLIHSHNRSLLPNGLEAFIDAHDSPHLWADHLACLFSLADKALGIPALLDPSDLVGVETPDERSVMTYLSQYQRFLEGVRREREAWYAATAGSEEERKLLVRAKIDQAWEDEVARATEIDWSTRVQNLSDQLTEAELWIQGKEDSLSSLYNDLASSALEIQDWRDALRIGQEHQEKQSRWISSLHQGSERISKSVSMLNSLEEYMTSVSDEPIEGKKKDEEGKEESLSPEESLKRLRDQFHTFQARHQDLMSKVIEDTLVQDASPITPSLLAHLTSLQHLSDRWSSYCITHPDGPRDEVEGKENYELISSLLEDVEASILHPPALPVPSYLSEGLLVLSTSLSTHLDSLYAISKEAEEAEGTIRRVQGQLERLETRLSDLSSLKVDGKVKEGKEEVVWLTLKDQLEEARISLVGIKHLHHPSLSSQQEGKRGWNREKEVWERVSKDEKGALDTISLLDHRICLGQLLARATFLIERASSLEEECARRSSLEEIQRTIPDWKIEWEGCKSKIQELQGLLTDLRTSLADHKDNDSIRSLLTTAESSLTQSRGHLDAERMWREQWSRVTQVLGRFEEVKLSAKRLLHTLSSNESLHPSPDLLAEVEGVTGEMEGLEGQSATLRAELKTPRPSQRPLEVGTDRTSEWSRLLEEGEVTAVEAIDALQRHIEAQREKWIQQEQSAFIQEATSLFKRLEAAKATLDEKIFLNSSQKKAQEEGDTSSEQALLDHVEKEADTLMEGIASLEDRVAEARETLLTVATSRLEELHGALSDLYDSLGQTQVWASRHHRTFPVEQAFKEKKRELRSHDLARVRDRAQALHLHDDLFTSTAFQDIQDQVDEVVQHVKEIEGMSMEGDEGDEGSGPVDEVETEEVLWVKEWAKSLRARISLEEEWVMEQRSALERKINRLKDKSGTGPGGKATLTIPGSDGRSRSRSRSPSPLPNSSGRDRSRGSSKSRGTSKPRDASKPRGTSKSHGSSKSREGQEERSPTSKGLYPTPPTERKDLGLIPTPENGPEGSSDRARSRRVRSGPLGNGSSGSSKREGKGLTISISATHARPTSPNPSAPRLLTQERGDARKEAARREMAALTSPKWFPGKGRGEEGGPEYVPDLRIPLDIAVARLVNQSTSLIRVNRVRETGVSSGTVGRYTFGETDQRTYYCRLLDNRLVMVRVGGGWMELSKFLTTHASFEQKVIPGGGRFATAEELIMEER